MARIRMFVGVFATAVAMLLSGAASAAIPVVAKQFVDPNNPSNPSPSVVVGGAVGLAYVILNPNPDQITGVNFVDPLPAGMRINPTNGFISGDCGGSIDAGPNATSVSFSGGFVAAAANGQPGKCTLILVVQGVTPGAWQNCFSVNSSAGSSDPAQDPAPCDTLTVTAAPPTVAKQFVDPNNTNNPNPSIPVGGVSGLAYVITNINPGQLTNINFVDPLPAGMRINPSNGFISGNCGGTIDAGPNATSVSFSGGFVAGGDPNTPAKCTLILVVQGVVPGAWQNCFSVNSSTGGSNTACDTLTITPAPPVVAKTFVDPNNTGDQSPAIPIGGVAGLAYSITNINPSQLTNINFVDALPAGMKINPTNGFISGDCGGTIDAGPNATSVSFSGGFVAAGDPNTPSKCTLILVVQGVASGNWLNSYSVNSSAGTSNTASDTLRVNAPPTISKSFNVPSVLVLDQSVATMTITIGNPNAGEVLTGLTVGDDLPAGLIVANVPNVQNTCGGTVTAVAHTGAIALQNGTLAAGGSCTLKVDVTGLTGGTQNNVTSQVTSTNGGTGLTASANILVISPPVIAKEFSSPTVSLNGLVVLTFVLVNQNPVTVLTGVAFTDNLPAGMEVSADFAPVIACTNGGTPGTLTAATGATSISVSGATVAANNSNCTYSVGIKPTTAGRKDNTSGSATSANGGTSLAPATATVLVLAPPTITKSFASIFNPPSVALNASTTMTFTIANPNPVDAIVDASLTGVTFGDDMRQQPGDVVKIIISTPDNGLTGNLCGGTLTAPAGSPAIALSGATIPPASSCTFTLSITGIAAGTEVNTTTPIVSANGGNGLAATATIYVVAPPVITMAFADVNLVQNFATILTFTIVNPPENTIPLTGVSFLDILPSGLLLASPSIVIGDCGGGPIVAPSFTLSIALSNATLPVGASCSFAVSVIGTAIGEFTNVAQVTSANGGVGNTATATLVVVPQVIPTLQGWALILMSLLLALTAAAVFARRARS